jgi:hypothetical protein
MSKGTPDEPSKYKRYGKMLTNAEHTKVVEKQLRYQKRKDQKKPA